MVLLYMGISDCMSHNLDDGSDRESSHLVGNYDESRRLVSCQV